MVRHHAEGEEDSSIQGRMSAKQSYKKAQRVVPLSQAPQTGYPPFTHPSGGKKTGLETFFLSLSFHKLL